MKYRQRLMINWAYFNDVDRGWSWVVLCAVSTVHFLVFGIHYSYGVIFPRLMQEFEEGEGSTAWIGSTASGFLFLFSLASVKLTQITSVWLTCLIGSILSGLGLIMTSFVSEFSYLYITHSLLFGVGTSLLYTPSLIVIAESFVKWRPLTTGIVVSFGSLGQLVLSPSLEVLLQQLGVRWTFRFLGILFTLVAVSCSCLLIPLAKRARPCQSQYVDVQLFKIHSYSAWLIIMMVTNYTYYIPLIYLAVYSRELKASPKEGSYLLMILAISAMLGRLLFGRLSNSMPAKTVRIYQVCLFLTGISSLCASFSQSYWHLVVYVIAYGLLDGSFIGLMSLVTLKIVGLADLANAWGMMLCFIGVPIALGPATVGWINDSDVLNHKTMFYFSGFPMIFGGFLMFYVIQKLDKSSLEIDSCSHCGSQCSELIQCQELTDKKCLVQQISVL